MNDKKQQGDLEEDKLFCSPTDSPTNLSDAIVLRENFPVNSDSPTQCLHQERQSLDNQANIEATDTDSKDNISSFIASFDNEFESVRSSYPTYENLSLSLQYIHDDSLLNWPRDVDVDIFGTSTRSFSPQTIQLPLDNETDSNEAKLPDFATTPPAYPGENIVCTKSEEISECSFKATSIKIEEYQELPSKRALPQDSDGDTYLHILLSKEEKAYTEQCLLCIPRCISGKKGLDTINCMGQTALHMSCYTVNIPVTEALLEHGAEPSLLDREGNCCLHIACELNSYPLVKCILSTLENMKNRTAKDIVNITNSHGLAPIHIATLKENISVVEILHDHGGNIDQQDDCCGKTPLMIACECNHVRAVEVYIERLHADVNLRTLSDYSALHVASQVNNEEIVKILLKHGAEVGTKTSNLKTEKDLSTNKEVKLLLERHVRKTRRRKTHDVGASSDPCG